MVTLLKTVSWAVVSGVLIGTTAYVETGSVRAALVTALVSASLKTPIYTIHEMAWKRLKGKPKPAPEAPTEEVEPLRIAA